jgi:hypothetical protein
MIDVMDQVGDLRTTALVDRLLERVEDEIGPQRRRHAPADNAAGEDVDDEGDVDEAAPRRHVGEVGHPQLVGPGRRKLAIDEIRRPLRGRVASGGHDPRPPAHGALQAHPPHHTLDRATGGANALAPQLFPHLLRAIDLLVSIPHALNVGAQPVVALRARRSGRWILLLPLVPKVVDGAIGRTAQIGSTPYPSRC